MKAIVAADIHEQGELMDSILEKENAEILLSCGDQAPYYEPPIPCYFVHGNHEDFALIQALSFGYQFEDNKANLNLVSSQCEYLGSDSVLSIGGMGGIYNPEKFRHNSDPRYFSRGDINYLKNTTSYVDVLLFHETLPLFNIVRRGKVMGCPALQDAVRKIKPKMTFSGHHDVVQLEQLDEIVCVQLGKPSDSYVVLNVGPDGIESYQLKNPEEELSEEITL